jgi:hypothetical protein
MLVVSAEKYGLPPADIDLSSLDMIGQSFDPSRKKYHSTAGLL